MQNIFVHIFANYDSLLPIGSDEITKRLQMWLNNPQCRQKEGQEFPIFWRDNHQGKSSHIYMGGPALMTKKLGIVALLYVHTVDYSTTF